jgi:hypothetical protein
MEITDLFKNKVVTELLVLRENYGGSDAAFARSIDVNPSVFNRLKNGEREKLLPNATWLRLGRELGVTVNTRRWNAVETAVFRHIREDIMHCKQFSKSMIFVDNCGIGKTFTAKYLSKTLKNCFYLDCTQCKGKNEFIKALARTVGVEVKGRIIDVKDNTKYYLSMLESPVIIVDEAGALDKDALGMVQEYWNATEGLVGWYMMGANALRHKISAGVSKDKDYYAELFSRFSENFSSIVPKEKGKQAVMDFYFKLIGDVVSANVSDQAKVNSIVKRCVIMKDNNQITGLRRAESLIILHNA